jgi:hypothetical protein
VDWKLENPSGAVFGCDTELQLWHICPRISAKRVTAAVFSRRVSILLFVFSMPGYAEQSDTEELAEVTVTATRVANERPAGTYGSVVTPLRFDPLTELQSRGLPEGQADVTVRGGLFENTGFKTGAVTIVDPQTGHYAAELPVDPAMLSAPQLRIGIDNAMAGFNANVATVEYAIAAVESGGQAHIGFGSDSLDYQSLRVSTVSSLNAGAQFGAGLSFARSSGDGSVENGDHDFERYGVQLQRLTDRSQTDLIVSHQDKFYGWPGAYTGFAFLPETDHTRTTLILANHQHETSSQSWEVGAFYRTLEDDYDFDRTSQESGAPGSFDHETRIYGIGFNGIRRGSQLDWQFAGQVAADKLVSSTDLTEGDFTSRSYGSISLVPSLTISRGAGRELTLEFGATFDWSDRDSSALSPMLAATWRTSTPSGSRFVSVDFAATSQLPGYTALNSRPTGLFGGNPGLGREKARQLSLSIGRQTNTWDGSLTAFFRQDDELVDWTFASGAPFARQANSVDLDVFGLEAFIRRRLGPLDVIGSYTWLDKDADYGTALVDASFYALNFATHRATFALRYRIIDRLEFLLDNEFRKQRKNPLRTSGSSAFNVSLGLSWAPAWAPRLGFSLAADNLTDDDYQQFPGTPAVGRHVSISARYTW